MHAEQELVNKHQRQADGPSFLLPRLVWPSVPHTDSKQLDIALPQDGVELTNQSSMRSPWEQV